MAETGMSKNRNESQPEKPQPVVPIAPPVVIEQLRIKIDDTPWIFKTPSGRKIDYYRRCPICWGVHKGYGTVDNTYPNGTSWLRCDQSLNPELGPCGFTWTKTPEQKEKDAAQELIEYQHAMVEHRRVTIDGKR